MNNTTAEKKWWKSNWFIGGCIAMVCLIGLFKFGSILAFFFIFPFIVDHLTDVTGINRWLAWAISVPLTMGLITAIGLLLSWKKTLRLQGRAIICVGMIFFSLFMFWMEKDYVYDANGGSSRCYALTPDGIEYVPCSWKVHRKYGTEVKRVSREIAMNHWAKQEGFPKTSRLSNNPDQTFFGPDGTPLVWYYQYPNGEIDLFSLPGIHPQLGVEVSPITREVVEALQKQRQDEFQRMREREAKEELEKKQAQENADRKYAEALHEKYRPIYIESRKRMGVIDNNGHTYDFTISDDGKFYTTEGDPTRHYSTSIFFNESQYKIQ